MIALVSFETVLAGSFGVQLTDYQIQPSVLNGEFINDKGHVQFRSDVLNCNYTEHLFEYKFALASNDRYSVIIAPNKDSFYYDYTKLFKEVNPSTVKQKNEVMVCDDELTVVGCKLYHSSGFYLDHCDKDYDQTIVKDKNTYYSTLVSLTGSYDKRDPSFGITNNSESILTHEPT